MNMKSECARDPTDREIQIALSTRQIKIDPRPQPDSYSSTSVDLTLTSILESEAKESS
jgi:hypothetical protein